jgi:dephospho-CoA kinase
MYLIGLTGGIAAGKSTVAEHWRKLGAHEIDADALAREAVARGSAGLDEVVAEFGPGVVTEDGDLNRAALGAIVFANEAKRERLEAIVHPIVRRLAQEQLAALEAKFGPAVIVIYNVPLLVETNSELPFDTVVTVEAPEDKQIARMMKHRGMSKDDAVARIRSQASPVQRAARADHILNSNQELALLLRDAENLYADFEVAAAQKTADIDASMAGD